MKVSATHYPLSRRVARRLWTAALAGGTLLSLANTGLAQTHYEDPLPQYEGWGADFFGPYTITLIFVVLLGVGVYIWRKRRNAGWEDVVVPKPKARVATPQPAEHSSLPTNQKQARTASLEHERHLRASASQPDGPPADIEQSVYGAYFPAQWDPKLGIHVT